MTRTGTVLALAIAAALFSEAPAEAQLRIPNPLEIIHEQLAHLQLAHPPAMQLPECTSSCTSPRGTCRPRLVSTGDDARRLIARHPQFQGNLLRYPALLDPPASNTGAGTKCRYSRFGFVALDRPAPVGDVCVVLVGGSLAGPAFDIGAIER